jgi:hypothetical protein
MIKHSAVVLGVLLLGTACGENVRARVGRAMAGCVATRNPAFTRGDGARALDVPLSPDVEAEAKRTAYAFGLIVYQETADLAKTQAELTCALELGAYYESDDTRAWLRQFSRHPDAPVSALATRLLERQQTQVGIPAVPVR